MDNINNVHLQENLMYTDTGKRYGIYQIIRGSAMDEFRFMRLDYVETNSGKVDKKCYRLVYTDRLEAGETLDSLYEKFNLNHPADYTGHSLSMSDIVVFRQDGVLKAYYVDTFGFAEIPGFMQEKLWELENSFEELSEAAVRVGDYFIGIQETDTGYDYTIYRQDYSLMDGGVYESQDETMFHILCSVVEDDLKLNMENAELVDYEELMEKVEKVEYAAIVARQQNDKNQKKDVWLEYYVAECEEFHHLKGYEVYNTLEEAALNYRILREDMRKVYFGNALGIIYHDNEDPVFDGSEYSFIKGDVIHADGLDDVKHFAESPEVCMAVAKMQELFPDYQVIEPKSLQKAMYPENMTADELADVLMNLAEEYDFYDYQDNLETVEEQKQRIVMDLAYGNKAVYIRNLKEMIEDNAQEAPQAKLLLHRIEGYEADKYPEKEPMIRIRYSENPAFRAGSYYKLSEAEKKIHEISNAEIKHDSSAQAHNLQKENYLLDYTLYYEKNGEKRKIDGYLGIVSEGAGIVQSIKEQTEEKLSDTSWLENIRSKGEEIYQLYMTELADIQEYVLPYLQQFVTLPEREPITQQVHEMEKGTVVKSNPSETGMKKNSEEKKLSIHERIERNREILAGKRGRNTEVKEMDRV